MALVSTRINWSPCDLQTYRTQTHKSFIFSNLFHLENRCVYSGSTSIQKSPSMNSAANMCVLGNKRFKVIAMQKSNVQRCCHGLITSDSVVEPTEMYRYMRFRVHVQGNLYDTDTHTHTTVVFTTMTIQIYYSIIAEMCDRTANENAFMNDTVY